MPTDELLKLQPAGRLGPEEAAQLLAAIRQAEAGVEFDFSNAEVVDVSVIQLLLVVVASFGRRQRSVIVKDSARNVLRFALELAGVRPESAGLSARITL